MKKSMLISLVMAFMTFMAGGCCLADLTFVTDTSKEGSLLIFPLVQTNDGNDTFIFINNTGEPYDEYGSPTDVAIKCYWEARELPYTLGEANTCPIQDAGFVLSGHNPILFKASDGAGLDGFGLVPALGEGKKGILKCWAVNPGESNQIAWNYLSGYAIIVNSATAPTSAWKYSAWRFAANVAVAGPGETTIPADINGTAFGEGFWVGKSDYGATSQSFMKLWGGIQTPVTVTTKADAQTWCNQHAQGVGTIPIRVNTNTWYCTAWGRVPPSDFCWTDPNAQSSSLYCCYPYTNATGCKRDNAMYDACPTYLTFDFLAEPNANGSAGYARNQLAVAPCKEDLRGSQDDDAEGGIDFDFPTRLSFEVWNENESKYTGTQMCAHCNGGKAGAYQVYLSDLGVGSINYFTEEYLHTSSGRFRVKGLAGGKCNVYVDGEKDASLSARATPLVGVLGSQLLNEVASNDRVGTGATTSGQAVFTSTMTDTRGPAYIRWDQSEPVPERKKR